MPPYENEVTVSASDYDGFADAYSVENESGLFNAYYERPAMLRLAGDVSGRRILDAGCGSGPLSAALRAKGAVVTGFDVSAAMVDLARERLGEDADVRVADLRAPLPYADAEFDDVVASLVLHYLEDWGRPLAELRRVLKPGGRLILSVNHPSAYAIVYPEANYFALTKYSEDYLMDAQTVWLTFWHRPLHAMTDAFATAGFRIVTVSEPPPASDTPAELVPAGLEVASRSCASSSSSSRPFETELHLLLGLRPAKRHRRSRARSRRRSRRRSRSGSLR
jgi:SAM-dependent methyltransferase